MKIILWIDWNMQDICKNEKELYDAYKESDCCLAFSDFLGDYCKSLDWEDIWAKFYNDADRDQILNEFQKAEKEDFWDWVNDNFERKEIINI